MEEFEIPRLNIPYLEPYLDYEFLGNSASQWLVAAAIFFGIWIIARIIKALVLRKVLTDARREGSDWKGALGVVIQKISFILVAVYLIYFVSGLLDDRYFRRDWLQGAAQIALILQGAIWGNALINFFLERFSSRNMESHASRVTVVRAVSFVLRLAFFSILLLVALNNLGFEVTTLIASLGVGGIAVALAVQNILADLFASLSISLDQPFVLGDFIIVDDFMGTVEHVGLKTTRVRSLSGEQLIFANNDLLNSRIRNFKRMQERRVVFAIGVIYETPSKKLEIIPGIIREIIEAQDQTRFDRAHFQKFGDFSLDFEIVYYVLTSDYNIYMDIQQAINFALFKRFEAEGIEFAYPTQKLFMAAPEAEAKEGASRA
jgi:small-conductance mechanosensitive channel